MSGLIIEALDSDSGSAKFDLTVQIYDEDQGLRCLFEYDAALFDETCIRRMAGHFQTMLNGIVTNPDLALLGFASLDTG